MEPPRAYGLGMRRNLNWFALATALLVPFGLFATSFCTMSFGLYYRSPHSALMLIASLLLLTLVMGAFSAQARRTEIVGGHGQRTWHHFVFMTALVACFLGTALGYLNLSWNSIRYYDYISLRKAVDVDPGVWRGLQALDVGEIDFAKGTYVDKKMHSLWHKTKTYCVAPMTYGNNTKLASYDFWAVGMDCCSAQADDFSCGQSEFYQSSKGPAGLRVMDEAEIQGYMLAVEQASAAYNIQAQKPIFLYMMKSPYSKIKTYFEDAKTVAIVSFVCYFVMQSILVGTQAYTFGKYMPSGYLDLSGKKGFGGHGHH